MLVSTCQDFASWRIHCVELLTFLSRDPSQGFVTSRYSVLSRTREQCRVCLLWKDALFFGNGLVGGSLGIHSVSPGNSWSRKMPRVSIDLFRPFKLQLYKRSPSHCFPGYVERLSLPLRAPREILWDILASLFSILYDKLAYLLFLAKFLSTRRLDTLTRYCSH